MPVMAALTSNTITADGTYTVTTFPGMLYVLGLSGFFGGGTLTAKWVDDAGNATAFAGGEFFSAGIMTFRAPSNSVQLVMSGDSYEAAVVVSMPVVSGLGAVVPDGGTVTNLTISGYTETPSAISPTPVVAACTLDISASTSLRGLLTASTACTFTMPTAVLSKSFTLFLKQAAATGNGTAAFTGVIWSGGTAPTHTATAGTMDIYSFVAGPNAAGTGVKWYGSVLQNFTPA
jgi:hypothetical protein